MQSGRPWDLLVGGTRKTLVADFKTTGVGADAATLRPNFGRAEAEVGPGAGIGIGNRAVGGHKAEVISADRRRSPGRRQSAADAAFAPARVGLLTLSKTVVTLPPEDGAPR